MGLTALGVSLSEEKRERKSRGRRRTRKRSDGRQSDNPVNRDDQSESIERALGRFSVDPPPMGFPSEIDPPPRTIDVNWELNAVSKNIQKKVGDIVMRRGEFGFLPQERVDEIATQ